MTETYTLTTPIEDIGQTITVLTFRPLTGGMLAKAGAFFRTIVMETGETAIEMQPDGMLKLIAQSAKITMRAAETLSAADFMAIQGIVMGFLGQTTPNNS